MPHLYIRCLSVLFVKVSDSIDLDYLVIFEGRYMAPELYGKSSGSDEIDRSVDVFSFAIIVQEVFVAFFQRLEILKF